jgi:hypothetical protein
MSNETDRQAHQTRMMLANSITAVLAYRFPWLRVNATADAVMRSYLAGAVSNKNDSGLTVEAVMGAMLDAFQTENAEVKRQFEAYVNNHGIAAR